VVRRRTRPNLPGDPNLRANAATGDLLRELTIDTTRDYQPRHPKTPKTATAEPTLP
jgi:hypothetical protein